MTIKTRFLEIRTWPLDITWILYVPNSHAFSILNHQDIRWYPDMDRTRANQGWVWFDSPIQFLKAIRILQDLHHTAPIDIPCKGYHTGNPLDGYDFDCEYENSADILCDQCVCNYGIYSPETGKPVSKRLQKIQQARAARHYQTRNH